MDKQRELEREIEWLSHTQAALDARLARVEDSMVFRALRAIGRFANWRPGQPRHYLGTPVSPPPASEANPRISIVATTAVAAQTYSNYEVVPTLAEATGEWICHVLPGDTLHPMALAHVAAATPGYDLIYTDEDFAGPPLRPVFKPDYSPVLLRSVPYFGGLTATRAGVANPRRINHIAQVLYRSTREALPMLTAALEPGGGSVSVIICSRTPALLATCLEALASTSHHETIVVQHGENKVLSGVIERFGARPLLFTEAFNFSRMNNAASAVATGDLLLFLNDDVVPLTPDWLARMASHLEDPTVGAVGAKLLYPDGTIQHAGIATWLIDGAGHPGRSLHASPNWPWLNYTREVSAVTGACLLVRRADFLRMEGFDETFPVNYNDVDLCLRLRAEGLSIIVDTGAVLRHSESQTRKAGTEYGERRRFFHRWGHVTRYVDPYYSPHLAQNNEDLSLL